MYPNFSKVGVGKLFTTTDGATYKKTSDLTFDDHVGIEQNIDPLFDRKIVGEFSQTIPLPAKVEAPTAVLATAPAPQTKFVDLKVGDLFTIDGDTFRKTGDLTFEDTVGIEQYWSPLVDKKINKVDITPVVDTSAKVVKGE
jgi:hypothetical protein